MSTPRRSRLWWAAIATVASAGALIAVTIGGAAILGSVPPSDRFPFGLGLLVIVGVPWLVLVVATLAAIVVLVVELVRRRQAADSEPAPEA